MAKLLALSGGSPTSLPNSANDFLDRQRFIMAPSAIAEVRIALVRSHTKTYDTKLPGTTQQEHQVRPIFNAKANGRTPNSHGIDARNIL